MNSDLLLHRLSPARLATYLDAEEGDLDRAIRLYEWNAAVSAALFEVIGHVEVVLRNSIHQQMVGWCRAHGHDENWFLNGHGYLDNRLVSQVDRVRLRFPNSEAGPTAGQYITELGFGFWRYLLSGKYRSSLWAFAIRHAFPRAEPASFDKLFNRVRRLQLIRNRVAHHEPIFSRRIDLAVLDAYLVARAIDPEIERWVRERSRVEGLLELRP
ncbi:MAG: hypothetical protein B7C54_04640 [Acidimicrobiales bacterium mtb01]|nr:hypothetical protein [Actinomycetota bacterium]TEX46506.1 MAG: hypothetical protein B7C54_04640 [Acidimicrobiales bacterium mtb01]